MNDSSSPTFIVASPRSGTKILRDTLDSHPQIVAARRPLNEIWDYGQQDFPYDSYPVESLTEDIRNHVRSEFSERHSPGKIFLEKNVFHSLRVPYVHEIFPQANFIHIVRDGRDVSVSLKNYRKNPIDWDYYLSSRLLEINPLDLLTYGGRATARIISRVLRQDSQVQDMGPFFEGYEKLLKQASPLKFAAVQWKKCVRAISQAFQSLDSSRSLTVHYESLLQQPGKTIDRLASFLNLTDQDPMTEFAQRNYKDESLGRWKRELTVEDYLTLEESIGDTLTEFDYTDLRMDPQG